MRLAKSDLIRVLGELAAALPSAKNRNLEGLSDGYYGALEDCSVEEVQVAARTIVKEDRFFPPASRIRRLVFEYRQDHPGSLKSGSGGSPRDHMIDWARHGMADGAPCPCCGSVLEWREGKRAHVYHDAHRHHEAGAPIIGEIA